SNREKVLRRVEKGIHGLSNSLLDVPWPKVSQGTAALAQCLKGLEVDPEDLFRIMLDDTQAADHELPQTGLTLEWERLLSSAFIRSADYGTRATTILLVDREDNVRFWERTSPNNQTNHNHQTNQVYYEFTIGEKGR
ncbi:MAG TPA: NRDE family protein, partial [Bacillota bacterium]|nr:NRDE family protein [Bacillota bacterium]